MSDKQSEQVLIWDLPTRLFHWLLLLSLTLQWVTAELLDNAMQWHIYIGYFTLGLLLFRVCWGFLGSTYAKFSNFLVSPLRLKQAVNELKQSTHPPGHNALGGWMIVAMLVVILLQAVSGLFTSDDVLYSGPYASWVSSEWQGFWQSIHHQLFNVILGFAGVHIAAVLWHQLKLKHDLIWPMITGKKSLEQRFQIASSKLLLAIILVLCTAALVYWLVAILPPVEEEFYY